jgi:AraC-like DNA-binding protein
MDDIRAVMDAIGSEKAILFGHSEGGSVSALFAATYPDRVEGLISFGSFAKREWSEDYPWAPTKKERQKVYDMIDNHWGSGEMDLVSLAPSMANNGRFMEWLARYFRSGASPSAALALTKMNTKIDIRGILDTISVPTLLLYRTNDIDVKVEEGRYLANCIKGAKLIEFPGEDHLFWVGETVDVLEQMIHFIDHDCREYEYTTVLSTILLVKINNKKTTDKVASTVFSKAVEGIVHTYLGNIAQHDDDYIVATFNGPSKAVHCAISIKSAALSHGLTTSQGLHIGEVSLLDDRYIAGMTLAVTKKIIEHTKGNQILITSTLNNLLSGTGLEFDDYGLLTISSTRQLEILNLREEAREHTDAVEDESSLYFAEYKSKSASLLEAVMLSIESRLTDDTYNIQQLSQDVGISSRQLQRRIKAITNKSPNQLIRSVRLHKAKEIILQEKKSIKEAAYSTGFTSLSYFSSCFKKEFGAPPSSFA